MSLDSNVACVNIYYFNSVQAHAVLSRTIYFLAKVTICRLCLDVIPLVETNEIYILSLTSEMYRAQILTA